MHPLSAARRAAIAEAVESFTSKPSAPGAIRIIYSTPFNHAGTSLASTSSLPWPWCVPYSSSSSAPTKLDISVLDSSFNPPTRAHLSLVDSPLCLATSASSSTYDAHLLLFSVRNADKGTGRPGDASATQRVEMMEMLAQDLEERLRERRSSPPNVAVAIVQEPLIFEKSTLLHRYFSQQALASSSSSLVTPRLHWVIGFDTLLRVFDLKYYASRGAFDESSDGFFQGHQRTRLVCARRGTEENHGSEADQRKAEAKLLASEIVQPRVEDGAVVMLDLPREECAISSTRVRKLLTQGSKEGKEKLRGMVTESIAQYLEDEKVYEPTEGSK